MGLLTDQGDNLAVPDTEKAEVLKYLKNSHNNDGPRYPLP